MGKIIFPMDKSLVSMGTVRVPVPVCFFSGLESCFIFCPLMFHAYVNPVLVKKTILKIPSNVCLLFSQQRAFIRCVNISLKSLYVFHDEFNNPVFHSRLFWHFKTLYLHCLVLQLIFLQLQNCHL